MAKVKRMLSCLRKYIRSVEMLIKIKKDKHDRGSIVVRSSVRGQKVIKDLGKKYETQSYEEI